MAGSTNVTWIYPEDVGVIPEMPKIVGEFGTRYNYVSAASGTKMQRLGKATANTDFDNIYPWSDIKLVNMIGGAVVAYLGDENFSRSGSNGDVMVEIPKFWYKVEKNSVYEDYWISNVECEGYKLSPMHDRMNNKLDFAYVSAYTLNSAYKSVSGASVLEVNRSTARSKIRTKGSRYYMMDAQTWFTIQLLYLIEFADTDSQTTIGKGYTNMSAISKTGGADGIDAHTGRASGTDGKTAVKYRHIENLWGNCSLGQCLDGINLKVGGSIVASYCLDPDKYAENPSRGSADGYLSGTNTVAAGTFFINSFSFNSNYEWVRLPVTADDGNGTNYYADKVTGGQGSILNPTNAFMAVGGSYNQGNGAGIFETCLIAIANTTLAHRCICLPY